MEQGPQMAFLAHKAGMDESKMDEIARKVYELTKNDAFYIK